VDGRSAHPVCEARSGRATVAIRSRVPLRVSFAGGAGCLLLARPETWRHAVARACEQLSGTPALFQFEATGLRT
jgi:hypothetical protein